MAQASTAGTAILREGMRRKIILLTDRLNQFQGITQHLQIPALPRPPSSTPNKSSMQTVPER